MNTTRIATVLAAMLVLAPATLAASPFTFANIADTNDPFSFFKASASINEDGDLRTGRRRPHATGGERRP